MIKTINCHSLGERFTVGMSNHEKLTLLIFSAFRNSRWVNVKQWGICTGSQSSSIWYLVNWPYWFYLRAGTVRFNMEQHSSSVLHVQYNQRLGVENSTFHFTSDHNSNLQTDESICSKSNKSVANRGPKDGEMFYICLGHQCPQTVKRGGMKWSQWLFTRRFWETQHTEVPITNN